MCKKMKIGIVGCGGFVRGNHLPNAADNPSFKIKALCDLKEDILIPLKDQYNVDYVTTDYSMIAADPEIEMLVIGTGPSMRVELIREAAENGKHIYVEKPMSLGREDSKAIVEIIRATGVKLQVGFNRPYAPIMQEAKRIYHKMKSGQTVMSYRIVGESQLWPQFHRDLLAGGESTIVHELTHIFNLLNWLTESDPTTVYAVGGRSDNNIITLTYPNEVVVSIVSGGCGTEAYPKERLEIFSNHSVLVMNEFIELECTRIEGEKDQRFPLKSNPRGRIDPTVVEHRNELMKWRDVLTQEEISTGYYYNSRPSVYKGHYDALDYLRQCIIEDRPTEINEYQGAVATITALKALESLRTSMPVSLCFDDFKNIAGTDTALGMFTKVH